jgi:hypothetical protein
MKNIFLLFICFCCNIAAKTQTDYTGNYHFQMKVYYDKEAEVKPSKDEIDQGRMGHLTLMKIEADKYKFWLSANRGWPSYNQGDIDGIIEIKNAKASFAEKQDYVDSVCKLLFFFNSGYITVEQKSSDNDCGFGHNVFTDGKYKKQNSKRLKNAELGSKYMTPEKYTVTDEKAYLFAEAGGHTDPKKQYFVKGDIIISIREKEEFIYTEFINPAGKFVYGWLYKSQLTPLKK